MVSRNSVAVIQMLRFTCCVLYVLYDRKRDDVTDMYDTRRSLSVVDAWACLDSYKQHLSHSSANVFLTLFP